MIIWVAGTPGVGKTVVGRELAIKLGYSYIDMPKYIKRNKLYESYDRTRRAWTVDPEKVKKALEREALDNSVISSHIILPSPGFQVRCVVLRLNPLRLLARLKRRGYDLRKICENVEAEFLGTVYLEAVATFGIDRVFQINTTGKKLEEVLEKCIGAVKGLSASEPVDWLTNLSEEELDRLLSFLSQTKLRSS